MVWINLKTPGKPPSVDGDIRQELAQPTIARANEDAYELISDADGNGLPSRREYRHRREQDAVKYGDGSEYQSSNRADAAKHFR